MGSGAWRWAVRVSAAMSVATLAACLWRWHGLPSPSVFELVAREVALVHLGGTAALALVRPELGRRWLLPAALLSVLLLAGAEGRALDPAVFVLVAALLPAALCVPRAGSLLVRWGAFVLSVLLVVPSFTLFARSELSTVDPLAVVHRKLVGHLSGEPVATAQGADAAWKLTLPGEGWYRATALAEAEPDDALNLVEHALFAKKPRAPAKDAEPKNAPPAPRDKPRAERFIDRAMDALLKARLGKSEVQTFLHPGRRARLRVLASRIPGAGAFQLDSLVQALAKSAKDAGFSVSVEIPAGGSFEEVRRLELQDEHGAFGFASFYVRGDVFVSTVTAGPTARFGALAPEVRRSLDALVLDVPPPPVISADVLHDVKLSTALVLTRNGSGTGWVVARHDDEVAIVTNAHVLSDPGRSLAAEAQVDVVFSSSPDAGAVPATVLAVDAEADLALVKAPVALWPPKVLPLRPTLSLPPGTAAFVVGFPFGMSIATYGYPTPTVNAGRIAAHDLAPELREAVVPIDVGINPGNSGGPVVDGGGAAIGVAVAHVPGSEVSFAIPTEGVRAFLQRAGPEWQPQAASAPIPAEPSPVPPIGAEARARAEDALVVVSVGGATGTGVVVEGPDGQLLVATRHTLVHDDDGRRLPAVDVTFRPGTPRRRVLTAEIARSVDVDDIAILRVAPFEDAPKGLPFGRLEDLYETMPLELLAFRLGAENRIDVRTSRPSWREATLSAVSFDAHHDADTLRVDAGVSRELSGGPLVDRAGRLVGFSLGTEAGTNLTLAAPAPVLSQAMRGAVRGGKVRYVFDGLGHCVLHYDVALDDPFHTVSSVGLAFASKVPGEGHAPEREGGFRYGDAAASVAVEGRNHVSFSVTPPVCDYGWLGYQLWTETSEGRVLEPQHGVEILVTLDAPVARDIPGGVRAGDRPWTADEKVAAWAPPDDWGGVLCAAREAQSCYDACLRGDVKRCFAVAQRVETSQPDIAVKAFLRACDAGLDDACELASELLEQHRAWPQAFALLTKACDHGFGFACTRLATYFRQGFDRPPDAMRALEANSRGCQLGDPKACQNLGVDYAAAGQLAGSKAKAVESFTRACQLMHPMGCRNLALIYWDGAFVGKDVPRAAALFERACELRDGQSCRELGEMQLTGRGTTQSTFAALHSYREACLLEDAVGCTKWRALLVKTFRELMVAESDTFAPEASAGAPAPFNPYERFVTLP